MQASMVGVSRMASNLYRAWHGAPGVSQAQDEQYQANGANDRIADICDIDLVEAATDVPGGVQCHGKDKDAGYCQAE